MIPDYRIQKYIDLVRKAPYKMCEEQYQLCDLIEKMIGGIMVVVSYDISNDKLRTKFAKYLSRFGHRLQYSVFEIDNSEKIVNNIVNDLKNKYEKSFSQEDSVIIFKLSSSCEVLRFGYAKNDEKDFIIIS